MSPVTIIANTFVAACHMHAELPSTNDYALALGREADTSLPLVVVAGRQKAGRGRGANRWWTGDGSLAFSLLIDGDMCGAAPGRPPLVSLAAAVAVIDAVTPLVPVAVGLHWPNDVFAAGRKLAGILVEVLPNRRHVIGIGLNVNDRAADAPAELRDAITTLRDLGGREYDRAELLIAVLQQFERQLDVLRSDAAAVAGRADKMCLQHGRSLTIDCDRETVSGLCEGIAPDGALRLRAGEGVRRFLSGTVRSRAE